MCKIKYNIELDYDTAQLYLNRIVNQIYKLLPNREEGLEWKKPLQSIILELSGFERLLNNKVNFFILLSKLESLMLLDSDGDFLLYRKTIFESLNLLEGIKDNEFFR